MKVRLSNYSENVNGIVTVVLPFVTFPNVQVLTAILMISSNPLSPVFDSTTEISLISPLGVIVNFSLILPCNFLFFLRYWS